MIFTRHQRLLTTALLCVLSITTCNLVHAFPGGAAACPANEAAVKGSHTQPEKSINTGSLEDGGFQMTLTLPGGVSSVISASNGIDFGIGQDHIMTLSTTLPDEGMFKGFLLRLGPGDDSASTASTTESLQVSAEDNTEVKIATSVCIDNEGVAGLTHTDATEKTTATGVLRMDEVASNLILDVTVVVLNQGAESEYYYTQYVLNAIEADDDESGGVAMDVPAADGGSGATSRFQSRLLTMMLVAVGVFAYYC